MSIENHPNLHAVGFTTDILSSYLNRLRGKAAEQPSGKTLTLIREDIVEFVTKISEKLDERFGV